MASRLYEILRKDVFSDIETGPWLYTICGSVLTVTILYERLKDWYSEGVLWSKQNKPYQNSDTYVLFRKWKSVTILRWALLTCPGRPMSLLIMLVADVLAPNRRKQPPCQLSYTGRYCATQVGNPLAGSSSHGDKRRVLYRNTIMAIHFDKKLSISFIKVKADIDVEDYI